MQLAMVGLGKMGLNMTKRLRKGRHRVVAFDLSKKSVSEAARAGAVPAGSLKQAVAQLRAPRIVWIMLPAGKPVQDTIDALTGMLDKGDIIIEGGNSYYKDDIRRYAELKAHGLTYVDAGVSGGIWGLKEGYCLMIGGDKRAYNKLVPIFKTLAPRDGYLYCGSAGSGHFVKMVHNGIEYGMMSAYGEGFELMEKSPYGPELNFAKVAHLWNQGSVIRSWLLELAESAFKKDPGLEKLEAFVPDSGEGRWTVQQAVESSVPLPVITAALFQRFASREDNSMSDRLLSALRNEFGGHAVRKKGK